MEGCLLGVRLDDFKLRVLDDEMFAATPGPSKDHKALARGDHFLDEMDVIPTADDLAAQGVCIGFLERYIKHFDDVPANANRFVGFLARETVEFAPVFIAPGEVGEQVFKGV